MNLSPRTAAAILALGAQQACAQSCSISWVQVSQTGPAARYYHAMAFDAARNRTVLFGGQYNGGNFGDTWTWNGSVWTLRATTGPGERAAHAMAYDAARQRVVLFGGSPWTTNTWTWDGSAWTQVATDAPGTRANHSMAYDAARARTVLFGGANSGGEWPPQTWEWDGQQWAVVAQTGPSPRINSAMAYDSARQRVVLFGGLENGNAPLNDTWEWDGTAWSQQSTFGPSPRWGHALVGDSQARRIILYGGTTTGGQQTTLGDTWEWDGTAWSQWQNPGAGSRYAMAAAYDAHRGRTVLMGGSFGAPNFYLDTVEMLGAGAPTITFQPLPVSLYPGQRAVLSVAASAPPGGGAVAYQWRKNGSPLTDGLRVAGAQTAVLIIDNLQSTDAAAYDVVVSNGCAQVASASVPLSLMCYANCDGSFTPPVLNVLDFNCFLNRFSAGCP